MTARRVEAGQRAIARALRLPSVAERTLETRLAQLAPDLAPAIREYRFAPPRAWRFDFAWPAARLAVEVDGGTWAPGGGRHNADADRRKLNAAAVRGWRVLRFSPAMLDRDPAGCVATIEEALATLDRGESLTEFNAGRVDASVASGATAVQSR